jgi:hypothetical protein
MHQALAKHTNTEEAEVEEEDPVQLALLNQNCQKLQILRIQ